MHAARSDPPSEAPNRLESRTGLAVESEPSHSVKSQPGKRYLRPVSTCDMWTDVLNCASLLGNSPLSRQRVLPSAPTCVPPATPWPLLGSLSLRPAVAVRAPPSLLLLLLPRSHRHPPPGPNLTPFIVSCLHLRRQWGELPSGPSTGKPSLDSSISTPPHASIRKPGAIPPLPPPHPFPPPKKLLSSLPLSSPLWTSGAELGGLNTS